MSVEAKDSLNYYVVFYREILMMKLFSYCSFLLTTIGLPSRRVSLLISLNNLPIVKSYTHLAGSKYYTLSWFHWIAKISESAIPPQCITDARLITIEVAAP